MGKQEERERGDWRFYDGEAGRKGVGRLGGRVWGERWYLSEEESGFLVRRKVVS